MDNEHKDPLRAGMIGAGSSSNNIAVTIAAVDGVVLVAVADVSAEAAKQLALSHANAGPPGKGIDVTTEYKDLLSREDVDFVVVSVPHGLHHEIGMAVLDAGKHLLMEKPIATTIEDAGELIATAREKGLRLGIHFQTRFFDAVIEAKRIVDSGELGKILQANVSVMWHRDEDYYKKSSWRGTWKLEGGGSIINQAIHTIDQMVHVVGPVKTLFGAWAHAVHDIEVDDLTAAAFVFENGAFGTLQTSTATKAAFPAKLTVFGTEGAIVVDGNVLTTHDADGNTTVKDFAAEEGGQVGSSKDPSKFSLVAHGRMMEDFVASVNDGRDPAVTGEAALESLKVVRAVFDSNGERVVHL